MAKIKPVVFSGVQPSGNFHLGNYLGALTQWLDLQNTGRCIFCVVDYHAITVEQDPKHLRRQILDIVKIYLAAGIDPKRSVIFQQSDIKEHTELAWILNCAAARMSDLANMTQFKDKSDQKTNVSVGLFDYPVLMAADILLYQTELVPVGEDQLQHVELARDLAKRFNHRFGPVFAVPKAVVRQAGARIMGLDDPSKKMSKSAASPANYVALLDEPAAAAKKIKRAVTDSGSAVKYDPTEQPAISNLLTIYSLISNLTVKQLEKKYAGRGYGDFKNDLSELVSRFLAAFQNKFNSFSDRGIDELLDDHAAKLHPVALATINKVKNNLGL